MDMSINADAGRRNASARPIDKARSEAKTSAAASAGAKKGDQIIISRQGRNLAQRTEPHTEPFKKMETALENGDIKALMEAARENAGSLEINWDAMVDPDGSIYGAAYVESVVSQYQDALSNIEDYYANAHQENLAFEIPYNHVVLKYNIPDSPYFRSDLSKAEREMSFQQETALLRGGNLILKDPYALASSGGILDAKKVEATARQAAREKLDALIQARKGL